MAFPPLVYIGGSVVANEAPHVQFLPRNTKFFDYFDRDTEVLIRAAKCFRQFLESSGDPRNTPPG